MLFNCFRHTRSQDFSGVHFFRQKVDDLVLVVGLDTRAKSAKLTISTLPHSAKNPLK